MHGVSQITSDPIQIGNLVTMIQNNLKQIENCNTELKENLLNLRTSFQDEGFVIIQNHIAKTRQQIDESVPHFSTVLNKMLEYAEELKISGKAISG
ncbi:MAG: hypothetical protein FWD47_05745 [Treponema sp.]|nr:hypothetical protein [Treponema sp.]